MDITAPRTVTIPTAAATAVPVATRPALRDDPAPAPTSTNAHEDTARGADVAQLSLTGNPEQDLARLRHLRQRAQDPNHPDPSAAAALTRAISAAEQRLEAEREAQRREEARREDAKAAAQHDAQQHRHATPAAALPAEALRPLTPAERLRRAAVESAYQAGTIGPQGAGFSHLAT